jgi:hypothetical protein
MAMSRQTQEPAYRVFTVVKRDGQDDFWLAIGAAFAHQDGDGLNVVLQALPTDGRLVLRKPKEDDHRNGRNEKRGGDRRKQ